MDFSDLAVGPAPQLPLEAFQRRRERLADQLDGTLVVATNPELTYSNDVEHRFRPHSDFWYLTGFAEPGAVLVLDEGGRSTLFCRARDAKAEVWTGRRLGLDRATEALGVDGVYAIDELGDVLPRILGKRTYQITEHNPDIAEILANHAPDSDPGTDLVAEMRLRKDAAEIDLLRQACDVGAAAMREALPLARAGGTEYGVEAALLRHYRGAGSTGPGYPAIVGAGANAAILHYIENRASIQAGDMVLVDAGCEWGYYNSDITRTVPADGRFSDAHADLYNLVHAAQKAALVQVAPGKTLQDVHIAASKVLMEGFVERGWMKDEDGADGMRRFYMHGTSHYLGLDVHDAGRYKIDGQSRTLEPGMVITVEPGLYLNPDFTDLPAGLDPLGIRIENDVVVTSDGREDLLAGLPTDLDGVEGLLQ
ncbi:MAG: aminopeptidase P N-terminal domain-containing protein [Thermoplasmatota archaeon]